MSADNPHEKLGKDPISLPKVTGELKSSEVTGAEVNESEMKDADPAAPNTRIASTSVSGHVLDGSQYHNIIEEQAYSEQPPTPEEQKPWRVRHLHDAAGESPPHHDGPAISVGPR